MKHLKMLGLAAAAAVVALAIGGGTASATVLCQTNTEPCTSVYPQGTQIAAALNGGGTIFKAGFATISCSESSLSGETANRGGSSETVRGLPAAWSTTGCNATVHILKAGELEIHHIPGTSSGTLTGIGSEVTMATQGISCTYGTNHTDLGTLTGSNTATIQAHAQIAKLAGGFLCASPATWGAEYALSTPKPLYVKGS